MMRYIENRTQRRFMISPSGLIMSNMKIWKKRKNGRRLWHTITGPAPAGPVIPIPHTTTQALGGGMVCCEKSAGAMHRVENILGPSGPSIYTHTGPSGPVCVLISKNTCTWSVRTKYMLFDLKRHTIRSVRTWWYTRITHLRCGVERTWPGPSGPGHVRMYTRSVRTWYTYTSKKATPPVPGPLGPGTGNNIFIGPSGPINMYTHVGPSGPTCVCKTKIKRSLF